MPRSPISPASGPDDLGAAYDRFSDLGLAVEDVLVRAGHVPDPAIAPSLADVAEAFAAIEHAGGPGPKGELFADLLRRSDPLTAKGIVKVLSGDLRIGLREGLVESAIAQAFDAPLAAVKRAGMLTGDLGRTASLARAGTLDIASLTLFHPLKFMLASPAEDADDIVRRLGPVVWVEDKYDGIRAQLHKRGEMVCLYSRDLHDISTGYPEIVEAAPAPAVGRHSRRRVAGISRRHRAALRVAPGPARPKGAVGGDPGGGSGDLRRVRRPRDRPARRLDRDARPR